VKFNELQNGTVQLVSCAADKSLVFRNVTIGQNSVQFSREHIVAEKTTFYDLTLDSEQNLYATACQDRNIRFYDGESAKLVKTIKGSEAEDGNINRLCFDPTHTYIATCGSDKTISILDKQSGEIVTTVFGHSESITGLAFTNDSKRLISTCGDSCVFVWKLSSQLTHNLKRVPAGSVRNQHNVISQSSGFRGRAMSESVKPGISQAILLDDDDELPSWLKKTNNNSSNSSTSRLPANHNSSSRRRAGQPASLISGLSAPAHDEPLSRPGGRWADRASEQLSLAQSVHAPSVGEEVTVCDAHQWFTENLAVKRYNSGSGSTGSLSSSTNLADNTPDDHCLPHNNPNHNTCKQTNKKSCSIMDVSLASPGSHCDDDQFEIEDIEISSPEPEDSDHDADEQKQSTAREVKPSEGSQQHATGIRPDSLNMHNKPNRVDGRTPSVDTQPIPIFVPQKSDGTKPTYDEDVEGFKVNISNTAQLSPDSVDKDNTTSEDQDSISEGKDAQQPPIRRRMNGSNRGGSNSRSSLDRSGGSGRTLVARTGGGTLSGEEGARTEDDEDDDENFGDAEESNNDGDVEEDDNVESDVPHSKKQNDLNVLSEMRNGRGRNSLTNQHLSRMTNQQLLNSKKTVDDIKHAESDANNFGFTQTENFEMVVPAAQTTDRASVQPGAKKFSRTHLTPGSGKVLSSQSMTSARPLSLNVSLECSDGGGGGGSGTKSTRSSMKESSITKQSPMLSETRKRVATKKPHGASADSSRDRSHDATTVGSGVTMKRRGGINETKGGVTGGSNADKAPENGKVQNIRRFKSDVGQTARRRSDNNLTKRQAPHKPSYATTAAVTSSSGNGSTVSANQTIVTVDGGKTSRNYSITSSTTSNDSSSVHQPGYAKATRSSNLKTTGSSSGSTTTLHKSGLTSSTNAELSEDSLDERSSSTMAQKPKRMSKAPLQKYASARSAAEKGKMKTWKSADSLYPGKLVPNHKNAEEKLSEIEESQLPSPHGSKASGGNFLTPTNPIELIHGEASGSSRPKSAKTVACVAPCFFCIRKETAVDDDEGFLSNEYRKERCACLPEQLLRMRPPKNNTDPGMLSDSDFDDSDSRSGSDYFVSQQDLNLAGCQRAVNRLYHSFKVVRGYHQQAEYSDEKDEIVQLLTDTCSQIAHTMVSRGMVVPGSTDVTSSGGGAVGPVGGGCNPLLPPQLASEQLEQLRMRVQLPTPSSANSSRGSRAGAGDAENSATLNLLQHYSDLLVNLVQQQLSTKELQGTSSAASETNSISATVSYNDMQATHEDFNSDAANDEEPMSVGVSHAASNETLEEI